MQRNEADASLDVSLHTLNGHTVSINLNVTPLTDIEGASLGCTMIMEDLTEEKRIRTTMARYMNTKIVEQVLAEGESALEGRLQNATILFSDIKDFTSIAERVGPPETVSVLNEYFTEMVEVVFAYNGILDKYIGDAIMAVFGPPFPSSSDADNAVRVAIRMQAVLRDLNARRARVGQPQFEIRIGINSGDVVAGSIGSTRRADYTVIGDGVNIAARLESANKQLGTAILISGSTQRALTGDYHLRELDLIRVKGKQEPLPVFEVMGDAAHVSSNVQSHLLREFSHGLASYRERDWTRAVERFSAALALDAHDRPSMAFKQRAAHYLASPPPDSWDGVWTLNEK